MATHEKKPPGTAKADSAHHRHSAGPSCPTDELLVGYLTVALPARERHRLEQHLRVCDSCLDAIAIARRRIGVEIDVAVPVPVAVRERVRTIQSSRETQGVTRETAHVSPTWLAVVRDRLAAVLRWPVLVPIAVAASVLLVVATNSTWLHPQGGLTRSIQLPQTLRVTANQAPVRSQPSMRAEVVETLPRGTVVEVRGEERDWYHVTFSGGHEGWVERQAFE
jgi:hypothetical protein